MFLVQITNMCLVLVFVMYLVNKDVVVSTNIFLSEGFYSSSTFPAIPGEEGRDHPSGTCR